MSISTCGIKRRSICKNLMKFWLRTGFDQQHFSPSGMSLASCLVINRIPDMCYMLYCQNVAEYQDMQSVLQKHRPNKSVSYSKIIALCVCVGACTALLGKAGAMACTVAVEESISEHYNSQIRALMELDPERYTELLRVGKMANAVALIPT